MIEASHFACSNWLIVPAALAVGETPPSGVGDQRFVLYLSGVVFADLQGDNYVFWKHETVHIRPDLDPALTHEINRLGIPTPAGAAGYQYTRKFQVEQWAPFGSVASLSAEDEHPLSTIGWACDAWRPYPLETLTDAFTHAALPRVFAGIEVDIAVRGTLIQRVNYQIALLGKIVFAEVIIT